MGKKYIIELLDDCQSEFKGIMVFGLTQEKQISVELIPEESMTPYTEPDMEQVRKEAWEAARKIAVNADHGGLSAEALREIFSVGTASIAYIFDNFSASEAIEKIRQYEQKQEEQIQVGDEVINQNKTAVVTEITDRYTRIMYSDGSGYALFAKGLTKTGRHFPEIAAVLEKMRES